MPQIITDTAELSCNQGTATSCLNVTSQDFVTPAGVIHILTCRYSATLARALSMRILQHIWNITLFPNLIDMGIKELISILFFLQLKAHYNNLSFLISSLCYLKALFVFVYFDIEE